MTSHTPQSPAGDDLVARLRNPGDLHGGWLDTMMEAADRIEALASQFTQQTELQRDLDAIDDALRAGAEIGNMIVGGQHTEPVAGEVERFNPYAICERGTAVGHRTTVGMKSDRNGEWVKASSYDALAAAKARVEEEYLRAWNERDAQRRRAEAAEAGDEAKDAEIAKLEDELYEARQPVWPKWADDIRLKLQSYGVDPGNEEGWDIGQDFDEWVDAVIEAETSRAEATGAAAVKRWRACADALLDVLADALDEHDTSHGEITDPGDLHWSYRARALKNEGSAT